MKRGDVYEARLDPAEGSEQRGQRRPVVVVSHDAINDSGQRVIVVPCTTYRGKTLYPTNVLVHAPDGGLEADSVVLCDQVRVLAKHRLGHQLGVLPGRTLEEIDAALAIALGLI